MKIKTKNRLLLLGIAVTMVLSYHLAVRKTLEVKEKHIQLENKVSIFQNGSRQLAMLKQKEMHYDSILLKHQLNGYSIQNNLLKMINSYAETHNIQVMNFSEPHSIVEKEVTVKTYRFTLKGKYNSIINLINKIEKDTKLGEIINLEFDRKENLRTSKRTLEATVMLKSFG